MRSIKLVLATLGATVGSRIVRPVEFSGPLRARRARRSIVQWDPQLLWVARPDLRSDTKRLTNSLGLRGDERWTYELWRRSNLARLLSPLREDRSPRGTRLLRVPEGDRRLLYEELRQLCRDHGLELIVIIG